MTRYLFTILAAGSLFLTHSALASPEFPAEIKKQLSMSCKPSCLLCHTVDPGIVGSANQPFADLMKGFGLSAGDLDSLDAALVQLTVAEPSTGKAPDTDADSFSDVSELKADPATNPNNDFEFPGSPGDTMCAADVVYGCGASIARGTGGTDHSYLWTLLALTLSVTGVMHRRRRNFTA